MLYNETIQKLRSLADSEAVKGMARFGIAAEGTLGVTVPVLRKMARETGKDHHLAQQLWDSGIHEARLLASFIDIPGAVTEEQMESWVKDFDSWDVCDQCCGGLFDRIAFAYKKANEWSAREEEFVKRAAFALMAGLAVHDKDADDTAFLNFLPIIKRESTDGRNYVRKAVNWALRQIGKRNKVLNTAAIKAAEEIKEIDSKSSRWIASDAIRELNSDTVQGRLNKTK